MENNPSNNGRSAPSNGPSREPNRKSDVLKALLPLVKACRDSPEDEGLDLIASCLADLPMNALQAAIARFLMESEDRWFPAPAKLRRLAIEYRDGVIPDWEWAWNEIMNAVRVWNQFDREACERARAMLSPELLWFVTSVLGGFYTLANVDSEELTIKQSHFRNAWSRQKDQAETLRKTPESLRPRMSLPSELRSGLEGIGQMERPNLEDKPQPPGDRVMPSGDC